MRALFLAVGVIALLLGGCYRITVTSGRPAGHTPVDYDNRWHHGAISGIVELGGNYDLDRICPGGWSEVRTSTSFLNGLVTRLFGVYTPQTITIVCGAGGA
jgi:hypothetical protein